MAPRARLSAPPAVALRSGEAARHPNSCGTATSSFVNAAFVPLLDFVSFVELKRRIKVVDSNRQINEMIRTRMEREAASNRLHLLSA